MTGYPPLGYVPDSLLIEVLRSELFGVLLSQDEDNLPRQWRTAARQIRDEAAKGRLVLYRPTEDGKPQRISQAEAEGMGVPFGGRPWHSPGLFGEPLLVRDTVLMYPELAELVSPIETIYLDQPEVELPKRGRGRPKDVGREKLKREVMIEFDEAFRRGRTGTWEEMARVLTRQMGREIKWRLLAEAWNEREAARGRKPR